MDVTAEALERLESSKDVARKFNEAVRRLLCNPGSFTKGASTNDFVDGPNSAGACYILYYHTVF